MSSATKGIFIGGFWVWSKEIKFSSFPKKGFIERETHPDRPLNPLAIRINSFFHASKDPNWMEIRVSISPLISPLPPRISK